MSHYKNSFFVNNTCRCIYRWYTKLAIISSQFEYLDLKCYLYFKIRYMACCFLNTMVKFFFFDQACKDFHACKWSPQLSNDGVALALHFDMMNETNHNAIKEVQTTSNHIITFSHFVPRCVVQAVRASKIITFLIFKTKTKFLIEIEPMPSSIPTPMPYH